MTERVDKLAVTLSRLRALVQPAEIPESVRLALVDALFRNARGAHFLASMVALFLGVFAWGRLQVGFAPYWLGVMLGLQAVLGLLVGGFNADVMPVVRRRQWFATYAGLNYCASLLWAVAAWLFFVPSMWVESLLVAVLLAGTLAGAILPFGYWFPLYLALALCIGTPLTLQMALHADTQPIYALMALLYAVSIPTLIRMAWTTFNERIEALLIRVYVSDLGSLPGRTSVPAESGQRDVLTDIDTLSTFLERARDALSEPDAGRAQILVLDLDRFDLINRTLGLRAGDYVLRTIAGRLQDAVADAGFVARIAADEFAVLVSSHTGTHLPARLQRVVARPIPWLGEELVLTASMGQAFMPEDGKDIEAVLQAAISAMKAAKREQRGQLRRYTSDLGELERLEKRLEIKLALAVRRGELSLAYQPKVRMADGSVVGAEALARWHSEVLGSVTPNTFIPVAEKTGQIGRIGEWVLREACSMAMSWPEHLTVAVNVSAVQLQDPAFAEQVQTVLWDIGLRPERLELEVTESAIMASPERVRDNLNRLRAIGVTLALDDFGTGYSSISHLQDLHVDVVKLDRSFVSGIDGEHQKRAIVRATIGLCRDLGLAVVAEGVERPEERAQLEALGCELAQGHLWSPPLASAVFDDYLGGL